MRPILLFKVGLIEKYKCDSVYLCVTRPLLVLYDISIYSYMIKKVISYIVCRVILQYLMIFCGIHCNIPENLLFPESGMYFSECNIVFLCARKIEINS